MRIRRTIAGWIAAAALAAAANTSPEPVLLTQMQHEVDALALSLRDDPAVKAARAAVIEHWAKQPSASTKDGIESLEGAVDEAVFVTLRAAAANDPANPRLIWTVAPGYKIGGNQVPGSRFGGDNPDRIYRAFAVDPRYRYEIHGQRHANPSLDEFTFEAWPLPLVVGHPNNVLTSRDIDIDAEGCFVVTLDAQPSNGRRNHLQLKPGTATVFVRDTLSDWSSQLPNELVIKRVDGPKAVARDPVAIAKLAAEQVRATGEATLKFINWAWNAPANHITPFVRPQDWGIEGAGVAVNRFSVEDDEALVITLDRAGAKYLGFQVTDPWLRSVDYWNHQSSLSDRQAKANPEGTITYVLSPKDPGVYNWLDTGGLNDGSVVIRWEGITGTPVLDNAVKEARVVKLVELPSALPASVARITPAERKQQLAERRSGFSQRVAL